MRKYLFVEQNINVLKEEVKTTKAEFLKRLIDQYELYKMEKLPELHPPKSTTYMGIACANLALLYLLTEQKHYLNEAKRWMKTVVGYEKWGNAHLVNVDLSASWILFGLSLAYDWLKEDLDAEFKNEVEKKLILQADIMYTYKKEHEGKGWSTNYYQNHNWINMTGLAAAGYALKDVCNDAATWTMDSKENFDTVFKLWSDDGSNYEGTVYWRYGAMWLFLYAHLLKVEEGINHFETSEMLKNTFYYRLYQAVPNLEEIVNFGDCHDRRSSHTTAIYYKVASEYNNGHAQYLANKVRKEFLFREQYESGVKPGILPEALFEMLFYDPSVKEKSFEDLPLAKHFEDLGLITFRSSWAEDALLFSMKTGHPGGKKQWKELWRLKEEENIDAFGLSHQHPDNNGFVLHAYGSYLAIDEGYNRHVKAREHNVVTVDGIGYPVENVNNVLGESAKKLEADGYTPLTDFIGEIEYFKAENKIVAFAGETAKMYDKSLKLDKYKRHVVYTTGGHIIMLDELASTVPHTYTWHLHTDSIPTSPKTGEFNYENGLAKMRMTNVFPEQAKYIQDETYVKAVMTTQEPDNYRETFMKTLKIENSDKETHTTFLNIFEPIRFHEEHKSTITKVADGNGQGVVIEEGNNKTVFVYARDNKLSFEGINESGTWMLLEFVDGKLVNKAVNADNEVSIDRM